jgi:hypothetical protein
VFYENGVKKEDCLDFNFVNDSRRDAFVRKLMKINRKKEEEHKKKGWTFNAISSVIFYKDVSTQDNNREIQVLSFRVYVA